MTSAATTTAVNNSDNVQECILRMEHNTRCCEPNTAMGLRFKQKLKLPFEVGYRCWSAWCANIEIRNWCGQMQCHGFAAHASASSVELKMLIILSQPKK
jgi:hypothetical protein